VTHRVIRCLVLVCNPTNIWETWNVRETDNLIHFLSFGRRQRKPGIFS
jgi:hypothetical protein